MAELIPNDKQKKLMAKKGYNPAMWNVLKEDNKSLIIQAKGGSATKVIIK